MKDFMKKEMTVLSYFCKKQKEERVFDNKIIWNEDLLMASDGNIMAYCKAEKTESPLMFDSKAKFTEIKTSDYEKLIEAYTKMTKRFNLFDFTFTLDFSNFALPDKLQVAWKDRYKSKDKVNFDFDKNTLVFNFGGGWEQDGGCTATYEDVFTEVKGKTDFNFSLPIWQIISIMKYTRETKLTFKLFTEREHVTVVAGKYMFLLMTCRK
jgi:hypothetical protein